MLETTVQTHDLQVVSEIQPCNGAVQLGFRGGLRVTLPADHPDHQTILLQAEGSLRRRVPVGVIVDPAGILVDLSYAHQVTVREVKDDDEDGSRLKATFWGFGAVCYLTRDHPEFERIRATLSEAAASSASVWFANRSWPVEGETEIWNKILDVRPAAANPG